MSIIRKLTKSSRLLFLALAIFTLPFNRSILIWQEVVNLGARFNPQTSFSIYVSEIFIILAGATAGIGLILSKRKDSQEKISTELILSLAILGLLIIQDLNTISGLLNITHLVIAGLFFILIKNQLQSSKWVKKVFLGTLVIQVLIGVGQIITQKSLGLDLLGEISLNANQPGIAKLSWAGEAWIRATGTFPHANLFAGYLAIGTVLTVRQKEKWNKAWLACLGGGLVIAYSQSAWLATLVGSLVKGSKKIVVALITILLGVQIGAANFIQPSEFNLPSSITERLEYLQISKSMIFKYPFGVGVNQFTAHSSEISITKLQPWEWQPVHNSFTLILNEWGILASLLTALLLVKAYRNRKFQNWSILITLIILASFDHYLISHPQGLLLLSFGLSYHFKSPKNEPKKSS